MPNDRITWFECDYFLINNQAMTDAVLTTSPVTSSSNIDDLLSLKDVEREYITFEHNYSTLNETFDEMPDDYVPCFISQQTSDINGDFSSPVYIEATFTTPQNSNGVTFNFKEDYPKEIEVLVTNDQNITKTYTFNPDTKDYVVPLEMLDMVKIRINFTKMMPLRQLKITSMVFGRIIKWGENDIKTGKLLLDTDIISDKVSINTLDFDVIDKDDSYNLANDNGLHKYFQKKQTAYAYEYINGQKLFLGKYFLNTFSWSSNLVKLKCVGYVGWLDDSPYNDGDIYNGNYAGPIIEDIFAAAGITKYTIDEYTYNTPLYGTLKPGTCRKALREILFACNSSIRTFKDAGVEIYKLNNSLLDTIYRSNKLSTKVTRNDYVYGVEIQYATYKLDTSELVNIVEDEEYLAGTHTVMFEDAYANVTIKADGVTLVPDVLKKYYCTFTIPDTATILITGNAYVENMLAVQATGDYLESGETSNIKRFTTTVCNNKMALWKAEQILEYLQSRLTFDIQTVASDFTLDGRRWIQNPSPKYSDFIGWYTSRSFNLTGGFIDTAKLNGHYVEKIDIYYAGEELYSGEAVGVI